MSSDVKTICVNCRYHSGKTSSDIWYNHRCSHPAYELERRQDPVSGQWKYGPYMEDTKHPYCREINTGDCEGFEETPTDMAILGGVLASMVKRDRGA